ncbi:TetR/AcrR family transcriptional regulator [Amycolatopsis sp. NPDC059021]|uniref:TetR/AcrR family transcriptional regulator n=1 Tax=Amycolatopsis sp. NPDC059021 TaxID=3346704 RepID=UPI003670EEA6
MADEQRRTQSERRAATTARLVEGAIGALVDLGYARTTAKEICARAEVSQGALFGRFRTLVDLMLAAAQEVARRQIENFTRRFARLSDTDELPMVLALVREGARDPVNAVWIELLVAARTDARLRERLEPIVGEYVAALFVVAERVPAVHRLPRELRAPALLTTFHFFDGEALTAVLYPAPELDVQRMAAISVMAERYLADPRPGCQVT